MFSAIINYFSFYLIVSFENYDENTIRIINQLDRNIHVQIAASNDIDKKGRRNVI